VWDLKALTYTPKTNIIENRDISKPLGFWRCWFGWFYRKEF